MATTVATIASGIKAWNNTSNIFASDDAYCSSDSISGSQATHIMHARGFGFAVPTGSTILGVTVRIEKSTGTTPSNLIIDQTITLGNGAAIGIGTNKASATNWPISDTEIDYGGTSDLWGASSTLTVDYINNANFGVRIQAKGDGSGTATVARIDAVWIAVEYSSTTTEPMNAGEFLLTGQDANFQVPFHGDAGSFTLSGQDVTFLTARSVQCAAGSFTLTIPDLDLVVPQTFVDLPGVRLRSVPSTKIKLPQP